jgi:hypothetical protein
MYLKKMSVTVVTGALPCPVCCAQTGVLIMGTPAAHTLAHGLPDVQLAAAGVAACGLKDHLCTDRHMQW